MDEVFGLLSSTSEPVQLLDVRVDGDILGRGARVRVSQRFRNQGKRAIEAVYKFPLPEGAAYANCLRKCSRKQGGDV